MHESRKRHLTILAVVLASVRLSQQAGALHAQHHGPVSSHAARKLLEAGNDSHHANKAFPSADVPSKCHKGHPVADRLVVAAVHKEDSSWLVNHVDVPFLAYHSGVGNSTVRVQRNGANEGGAYLQFIAEYYDCLPEVTAFIHAHRSSWHSDDMAVVLQRLKWDSIDSKGYMPLHFQYFQPYGMYFVNLLTEPTKHLQTVVELGSPDVGETFNGTTYDYESTYRYRQSQAIAFAWETFWGPAGLGALPHDIQYYCCAQFATSAARIQRLPREFYLQAVHWAEHGETIGYFHPAFFRAVVLESLWHIILGEQAYLPRADHKDLLKHYSAGNDSW